MGVNIEKQTDKQAVVKLAGQLDANMAESFKTDLENVVTNGLTHLVVDMEAVSSIDSSGLSGLVAGFKTVRGQGGALVLANVGPQAQVALEMSRLNQVFAVHTDVASALASF